MRKFLKKYNFPLTIISLVIGWFLLLQIDYFFSFHIPVYKRFLGPIPWANFDGGLYLLISTSGYGMFQQAFFPLFPILIHIAKLFFLVRATGALFIVYVSLFVSVYFFIRLALLDMSKSKSLWALIFFLLFPTSFFLRSIYTESLFLALSLGSFYLMRKEKFWSAALLAGFASATRITGAFLVIALVIEFLLVYKEKVKTLVGFYGKLLILSLISLSGFIAYASYLWIRYADPLLFVHVQNEFGAHRTSGKIILLPQVVFRYIKIFLTVNPVSQNFLVALLEFSTFVFALGMLLFFWKKVRMSYLIYSLFILILPTLTGTLSSVPRYILVIFPLFFLLGNIKNLYIKIGILLVSSSILFIICAFFLRGYFIS